MKRGLTKMQVAHCSTQTLQVFCAALLAIGAASLGFRMLRIDDPGLELEWWTESCGGASVDGPSGLQLDATVGQHDAGLVADTRYELSGGYWAILSAGSDDDGKPQCPTDLDFDSVTDSRDLAILLSAWGPVANPTFADITMDGRVDVEDLAALLAGWGSCGPS